MNALDAQGGYTKWRYPVGFISTSAPAVALNGTIYFGTSDGSMTALKPDGSLKWRYQIGYYSHYGRRSEMALSNRGRRFFFSGDRR
jgi:outer membrane protein assembly factor BamB